MFETIIANGQIIDGSGAAPFIADLAISSGRIATIGKLEGAEAARRIDAAGFVVAPGFIDVHSHGDLVLAAPDPLRLELYAGRVMQGITTEIIGNCGLGVSPLTSDSTLLVRGITSWMHPPQADWSWSDLNQYLSYLEKRGVPLNVGALQAHGPLRLAIMGLKSGAAGEGELKRMRGLLEEALEAGAFGMSSGLIYPPGMYAASEELVELARALERSGRIYTSHIRGSSELLIQAVEELVWLGRRAGCAVHHSHCEAVGRAHWPKLERVLGIEEEAERSGTRISFDMFPYDAAATMMVAIFPPWSLEGGVEKLLERLADPKTRALIARDIESVAPEWPPWRRGGWPHNLVKAVGWDKIYIGSVAGEKNRRFEMMSLAELGRALGKTPFDAVADLLIEERGAVSQLIFEITSDGVDLSNFDLLARHRLGIFATDANDYGRGRPHPACYGAFPRILGRFARERRALSLVEAVRKMTSRPADLFSIKGRGRIARGAWADLVIFDEKRVQDAADYRQPRRPARGIEYVFINGRLAVERGKYLGQLAGQVLRAG